VREYREEEVVREEKKGARRPPARPISSTESSE